MPSNAANPSNSLHNDAAGAGPLQSAAFSGIHIDSSSAYTYSYHMSGSGGTDFQRGTSLPPLAVTRSSKTYSPARATRWSGGGGSDDDFRTRYWNGSLTRATTPGDRDSLQEHLDKFPIWKGLQHNVSPEPGDRGQRRISMTGA